jgi:hypothetical protein
MTRAEDLLQALNGLQRAADSELSGDAREAASQYIKELFRFAGFDGEDAGEGRGEEAVPFAEALAEVRTQAEGELSGNAFDLASIIFDDLANLSPSSVSAPQEHAPEPVAEPAPHCSEPASETPVESPRAQAQPAGPNFNELAAASKSRVENVAASLHHYASPLHEQDVQEQHDVLADMEFEKRSSEPCSMPEIVPLTEEAPAVVGVIEAASAREVAEATHDFGIPAAAAGQVPEYAAPHKEPAPQAVEFKPGPAVAAATAPETAAEKAAAPRGIGTKAERRPASTARAATPVRPTKTIETAPKPQHKDPEKTFFSLWLDMLFGRKK